MTADTMIGANAALDRCISRESERLGFSLGAAVVRRLSSYFGMLERWGQRIRLSGSKQAIELVGRHLADALHLNAALTELESARAPQTDDEAAPLYLDVGSGGGLPALPLLALAPKRQVVLVESRSRKATFLRSALYELELGHDQTRVLDERLETLEASGAFNRPFSAAWSLATFAPAEWLSRAAPLVAPDSGRAFVFLAGDDVEPPTHPLWISCGERSWQLADGRPRKLLSFRLRDTNVPRGTPPRP
jgi:16S rRNA G527 N7-methylase RsmG